MHLQTTLDILIGESLASHYDAQRYVDWAVDAMVACYEGENLYILAGLDHEPTPVKEHYFRLTVEELGLNLSTDPDLQLRRHAEHIARQVVQGELPPVAGVRKLFQVYVASGYAADYSVFEQLDEDIDTVHSGYGTVFGLINHVDEQDDVIRHHCSLFLSCPLPTVEPPPDLSKAYCHRCRVRVSHYYAYRWSGWWPPRRRREAICANCGMVGVAVPES